MSEFIKCRIRRFLFRVSVIPKCYLLVPLILFGSYAVIRIATGPTHLIYNALDGRGIFFGPFWYSFFYGIRLLICALILDYVLFSRSVSYGKGRGVLLILISAILLLLEYKLIFGGVSIILAMVFALLTAMTVFLAPFACRYSERPVTVISLVFICLQIIHFIQLISLAICI